MLLTDEKLQDIESAIDSPTDATSSTLNEVYAIPVAELEWSYAKAEVKAAHEAPIFSHSQ